MASKKPRKPNIRTVNKLIAEKYPGYAIHQGEGYVYFTGPLDQPEIESEMTPRISDQSPEEWVREVGAKIEEAKEYWDPPTTVSSKSVKERTELNPRARRSH